MHRNRKAEVGSVVTNANRMEEKRQIKQMGIDGRQLVMAGKDNDSTESYSARDNLSKHTVQMNLLVQKLPETSLKIGHNCNSPK